MTASRTILALAAAAAFGAGLSAWSPLAQAQSSSTPPSATSAAPMMPAPSSAAKPSASSSTTAQTVKPRSDAQVEARITQLRQLKITKDQESDWGTLAQDMRDNAHDMTTLVDERNGTAKSKPMNAVDNLKNYEKIADAHADGLKKIVPDFEKLYGEMSPAQQKTADTVFNTRVNQRVRSTATPSSAGKG